MLSNNLEGALRFQAPQAPVSVTDIQIANADPPQCYQAGTGISGVNPLEISLHERDEVMGLVMDEDCLFLK